MVFGFADMMYSSNISLSDFVSVLTSSDEPSGIYGFVNMDSSVPRIHVSASPVVLCRKVVDLLGILMVPHLTIVLVSRFKSTKLPPAVGSSSKNTSCCSPSRVDRMWRSRSCLDFVMKPHRHAKSVVSFFSLEDSLVLYSTSSCLHRIWLWVPFSEHCE